MCKISIEIQYKINWRYGRIPWHLMGFDMILWWEASNQPLDFDGILGSWGSDSDFADFHDWM